MTTAQVLSIGIAQTWQVARARKHRVVGCAICDARTLSRVAYAMDIGTHKCLTPPIWSSPVGLFSRWSSTTVLHQLSNASRLSTENIPSKMATLAVADDSNKTPREFSILTQVSMSTRAGVSKDLRPAMVIGWLGGAAVFALVALMRFVVSLRQIRWATIATPPEVSGCVARLSRQLRLRQKVGV